MPANQQGFFWVGAELSEGRKRIDGGGHRGGRGAGERGARDSSFCIHPSSFGPSLPGCGAKRPCRSSGLRRGCRWARPKGPSPCSLIWLRAKTNAKPQAPSNPAPNSNSNLRFEPFLRRPERCPHAGHPDSRRGKPLPDTRCAIAVASVKDMPARPAPVKHQHRTGARLKMNRAMG